MTTRSATAALLSLATLPLLFAARVLRGGPRVSLDLDVHDIEQDLFVRNDAS